jgi:hypothetical protein
MKSQLIPMWFRSGAMILAGAWLACVTSLASPWQTAVDPAVPLALSWSAGEWNTAGVNDGWSATGMTHVRLDGQTWTATLGPGAALQRSGIVGGADLDLGFHDLLEFRLRLPAAYQGSVVVQFGLADAGLAGQGGFSANRRVEVPPERVAQDGAFHVYRLDLGRVPLWRGRLTDLRLEFPGATGSVGSDVSLDWIRTGDVDGDIYVPRYSASNPAPGATNDQGRVTLDMQSKHFRILWDPVVASHSAWRANMARGTLRNLEEAWQVFVRELGYREPAESWTPSRRDGRKFKVNITTWYGGYWAGGDSGDFGRLNITPDGLRVDPPGWVVPHELMHVLQMHQGGGYTDNPPMGPWWEAHANYGRERWLYSINSALDPAPTAGSAPGNAFARTGHLFHGHGVHYYDHWPIFLYLDENPDGLAALRVGSDGRSFVARVWQESRPREMIYETLQRLVPDPGVKDLVGLYARRNVTWDYSRQSQMRAALATQDGTLTDRLQYSFLQQRPDAPDWWEPPAECAPMQYAFAYHELLVEPAATARSVTIRFRGRPDAARGADWRWSLVAVTGTGQTRYSALQQPGTLTYELAPDVTRLFLCVAATPDQILPTLHLDRDQPYATHPARARFPYEVQLTGCRSAIPERASAGLVRHANGGGWKASTTVVDPTAFVGPSARVLGTAQVRGRARVEDHAVVRDTAQVRDDAVVSGNALVRGNARVTGSAVVRDTATLSENARVSGLARVAGHASLIGNASVGDRATVRGYTTLWSSGGAVIGGDAVLDGDCVNGNAATNGFHFGWEWGGLSPATIASKTSPRGLFVGYEFAGSEQTLARDLHGATHGVLRGNPVWEAQRDGRRGVLRLDGESQVQLDRDVADLSEITVAGWIRWDGGPPNQRLLEFASQVDRRLWFSPADDNGALRLHGIVGGETATLAGGMVQTGRWHHVAFTIASGTAALFRDGVEVARGPFVLSPRRVLAPNVPGAIQFNALGRGLDGHGYRGHLDSVRLHVLELSPEEIRKLAEPPPDDPDLVAWYRLDEAAGTRIADASGNQRDASLVGTRGELDGAMAFDGTSTHIVTPVQNAGELTLSAWIHPRSSDDVAFIESVFDCDVPGQHGTGWGLDAGRFRVILDDRFWETGVPVRIGAWQHVALTFTDRTARLYTNGILAASLAYTRGAVTAANFLIGKSRANALFFDGAIADARIHSRALGAQEVSAVFLRGTRARFDVGLATIEPVQPDGWSVRGFLALTNVPSADVRLAYGPEDAGSDAARWPASVLVPNRANGAFEARLPVVAPGSDLWVRAFASNRLGTVVSTEALRVRVPALEAPAVSRTTNGLRLTWSQDVSQVVLESTESLHPAEWTPWLAAPRAEDGHWTVDVPQGAGDTRFFRLRWGL